MFCSVQEVLSIILSYYQTYSRGNINDTFVEAIIVDAEELVKSRLQESYDLDVILSDYLVSGLSSDLPPLVKQACRYQAASLMVERDPSVEPEAGKALQLLILPNLNRIYSKFRNGSLLDANGYEIAPASRSLARIDTPSYAISMNENIFPSSGDKRYVY